MLKIALADTAQSLKLARPSGIGRQPSSEAPHALPRDLLEPFA